MLNLKNIYKLQTDCTKTITVIPREPDIVPTYMNLDKTSGSTPLDVTITTSFKNNTNKDISNFVSVLWINNTPITLPSTEILAGFTTDISVTVTLSTSDTYYIRPEIPDDSLTDACDSTLELLYGDVDFDGKVTQNDVDLIANYASGLGTLTFCQKVLADVTRNGVVNIGDATVVGNYINNIPITAYRPTGRKVVTISSQSVIVSDILPTLSSCIIPTSVIEGSDASVTVSVLGGNVDTSVMFDIKDENNVVCSTTDSIIVPGDLSSHDYYIVIPANNCLGKSGDYVRSISLKII